LKALSECEFDEAEPQAEAKFMWSALVGDKKRRRRLERSSSVAIQDFVSAGSSVSGIVPESSIFFILSSSFAVRLRQY
jgi:hypothetical protein